MVDVAELIVVFDEIGHDLAWAHISKTATPCCATTRFLVLLCIIIIATNLYAVEHESDRNS